VLHIDDEQGLAPRELRLHEQVGAAGERRRFEGGLGEQARGGGQRGGGFVALDFHGRSISQWRFAAAAQPPSLAEAGLCAWRYGAPTEAASMSAEPTDAPKYRWVGTRPIRPDGLDKVTGRARFGADLSLPGMLWGKVLRSEVAHGRIVRIDTSKAEAMEGVKAVATATDLPQIALSHGNGLAERSRNVLAREKVLYRGHALAAVAATSEAIAERALAAIEVEIEALPAVFSIDDALAPGAPVLHDHFAPEGREGEPPSNIADTHYYERGDVEAGLAASDVVLKRSFRTATLHQGYIEPHAVLASTSENGQCEIYCCTQGGFGIRKDTAAVLQIPESQIKVTPSEIGGGFGGKTTVYLEPVAVVLSRKAARPVKMVMSREEVFRASGPAAGSRIELEIGADRDGKLLAGRVKMEMEAGAFPGSPVNAAVMTIFSVYEMPHFVIEGFDIVLNKPKMHAYRAPGAPMPAFALESLLDELAEELGADPIDLRLANAVQEGSAMSFGPRYRRIGFIETLEAAKAHPHYSAPLAENQGRGVASGFWFNAGLQSSAEVHLTEDGGAVVVEGSPDIGGSRASMAIFAAEELGIDVASVRPVVAHTDGVGFSDNTGGSRVTFATGLAVIEACRQIVDQLRARAAKLWECEVDQVAFVEGRCVPAEGSSVKAEALSVAALARQMERTGGPISGQSQLTARGVGPSFATHICDVEVDPDTGRTQVLRYTAIQDAGRAIHPSYVEGQMQGGAVQGIGWALNEEYVYSEDGELENAGFLDYRMPVASDLPMIDTVIVEVPNPKHPYGVRGVGETPLVPPLAAVANAVKGATGVRMDSLPISPPRLLAALHENGAGAR